MTRRARVPALAAVVLSTVTCGGPVAPPPSLDWLLGEWHGVRRDGSDGSEAPMTVHVESLSGGPGQIERLQVLTDGAPYVGFSVRLPLGPDGPWLMRYANSTRETFARLEGEVDTGKVTWRSVTPGRTRESRTVIERLDADRWRRTHRVSEDGGKTWRILFTDELERDE
jgi:hypothetical protein